MSCGSGQIPCCLNQAQLKEQRTAVCLHTDCFFFSWGFHYFLRSFLGKRLWNCSYTRVWNNIRLLRESLALSFRSFQQLNQELTSACHHLVVGGKRILSRKLRHSAIFFVVQTSPSLLEHYTYFLINSYKLMCYCFLVKS
jgi:hypothetical protein